MDGTPNGASRAIDNADADGAETGPAVDEVGPTVDSAGPAVDNADADKLDLAELRRFESGVLQLLNASVAPPLGGFTRANVVPLLRSIVTSWRTQESQGQNMRQLIKGISQLL